MDSLTVFSNNGIELVIAKNGEAFATQAGYVRMSGKAQSTISERVSKGVRAGEVKMAEIQTRGGLQGVRLIPAKLVFKWLLKDNLEIAEKMGEVGATVYLHQLAGYKVNSTAVNPEQEPLKLPPSDVRVTSLYDALKGFGIDIDNPRYKQAIQDQVLNVLGVNQLVLPATSERWAGVVEIAEEMGYKQAKYLEHRSALGKYVSNHGANLNRRQELRLCNGTQRQCWIYRDCDSLRNVIAKYFTI